MGLKVPCGYFPNNLERRPIELRVVRMTEGYKHACESGMACLSLPIGPSLRYVTAESFYS